MIVIPAIDLKDGKCVRLRQGRMEDSTVFSDDPVSMAGHWREQGARRLHLVDLDGAFAGKPVNGDIIRRIAASWPDLPLQIGGGVRDLHTVESYLQSGVSFVIIGTQAVRDPGFVFQACAAFPGHIMVGLDARNGKVATEGWAATSELTAVAMAEKFAEAGVTAIIYTDIDRDGMMQGVNIPATVHLAEHSSIPVIASGGVSSLEDIRALKAVCVTSSGAGISAAITGRAIYEGKLDLQQAQQLLDD